MAETTTKKVDKSTKDAVKAKTPIKATTAKKVETKPKTDAVKETTKKTESKKTDKVKETKTKKPVKKYILKVKKENKKKSAEAKAIQKTLVDKKKLPTFRGRFGKKNIRKKSIAKWKKWRKPRSIDLDRGLQHGFRPKIGYRNKAILRGIHPSGYVEIRVENVADLSKVDVKLNAIRISATVGKRKRNLIVTEANKKGIWILN
jgi:large subunit ribosomal protein L32e